MSEAQAASPGGAGRTGAELRARPGIYIENLSVRYGTQAVIEGLNLSIAPGSFFTLLGSSGCGKTTLLRTMAGFVQASAGRIRFGDQDVTALPAHLRDIGMVFQDYALFPDKTVFENVAYGLRARRVQASALKARVGQMLERVALSALAGRLPAALSGGQRQRVALARALVIEPQVLLMDEPLSNLDAKLRQQMRQTIAQLQSEAGITTVFVTHDQDEALALSHHIGVMDRGRLAQVGTPVQVYQQPVNASVADFVGAANLLTVSLIASVPAQGSSKIALAGGFVAAIAPQALPAGPAKLMLRPECIGLAASETAGTAMASTLPTMPGTVAQRQYLGEKTSYRVRLEDGQSLNVACHGNAHDAHAVGAHVRLSFDPTTSLLLPA